MTCPDLGCYAYGAALSAWPYLVGFILILFFLLAAGCLIWCGWRVCRMIDRNPVPPLPRRDSSTRAYQRIGDFVVNPEQERHAQHLARQYAGQADYDDEFDAITEELDIGGGQW